MAEHGRYRMTQGAEPLPVESSREFPRVEAAFRVQYETIDQLVVAYSNDLSKGGLFLRTQKFLPVNAVLRLLLDLPLGGGEIPVICRVVYVRDEPSAAKTGKPAGMGLQFLDLNEVGLRRIEECISGRPLAPESVLPVAAASKRTAIKLLVVDDEPLSRERAVAAFRARGDTVKTAVDGLDALAECLKDPPDVILSDVEMPRLDGWNLIRMVRARATLSSTPFIFLTCLGGEKERLFGYQLGVDDFVAKPYQSEELVARVDRIMARVQHGKRALVQQKTLRGDLEQVSLPSILGFLELERKTGELLLVGKQTARVYLKDGRPLRVELDGSTGTSSRQMMHEVLGWDRGQFEFGVQNVTCADELSSSLTALLIDHARRNDEMAR